MKITDIKTFVVDCFRTNWSFVKVYTDATDIIGLKQNPTNGRRFSPIFSFIGHFRHNSRKCYFKSKEEN